MDRTVPGIERFLIEELEKNSAIGLVTNHTGITPSGAPLWQELINREYKLRSILGPEHGFRGAAQDSVELEDDEFQGIKVYSLYGKRLRPNVEMFQDLDLVLFDLQGVGSRYYTYLYTLAFCMEICEKAGKRFMLLDRPNPIGCDKVEGNAIGKEYSSFVGDYGLTNRYGLTNGEYAQYLKGEYYPDVDLHVVWMENYRRRMLFSDTGLPWPLPSPNLPSLLTALVYPGTCLFEGTNLSEGRGTTRPFEIIGAPWIDGQKTRKELGNRNLPGVVFSAIFFTPTFFKYKGELCQGILIHVIDPKQFRPLYTAITMFHVLYKMYGEKMEWLRDWERQYFLDRLAGGPFIREMLPSGASVDELYEKTTEGQETFEEKRARYLHYT